MAKTHIEGFPQTQAEMAEWQEKYTFEGGKWYEEIPSEALVSAGEIEEPTQVTQWAEVQEQLMELAGQIGGTTKLPDLTPSTIPIRQQALTYLKDLGYSAPDEEEIQSAITTLQQYDLTHPTGTTPITPIGELPEPPTTPTTFIDYETIYSQIATKITTGREDLWSKIKSTLGIGETKESAEDIIKRLYPDLPTKVTDIDTQLARLKTSYELGREKIEAEPMAMPLIMGEQAALGRQYEIKRQGLLLERDALMGDYDRAVDRARAVLGLEREQKAEERANQQTAIDFMLSTAEAEEALALEGIRATLARQETMEERKYQQQLSEISDIRNVIASAPEAFIGQKWPSSFEDAIRMKGQYKAGLPTAEVANVDYWVKAIESGTANLSTIPSDIRSQVVEKLYAPREWTDEEFRIAIRAMKTTDKTYQEALDEIAMDDIILNKDRAREIAAEVYGIELPKPTEPLPEEMKGKTVEEAIEMGGREELLITSLYE